jgi:hypothetical protein
MLTEEQMAADLRQTLLTSHKGVDLHAATARRVMQRRLTGGDRLADLRRCEFHVFGGTHAAAVDSAAAHSAPTLASLLGTGRCYNPNKHRYGHFELESGFGWDQGSGGALPAGWPGRPLASDAVEPSAALLDELLGGCAPVDHTAVDVAAWLRGQEGGLLSGTLWRLIIRGCGDQALATGKALAVARGGRDGLLVNPHLEYWLVAAGPAGA